MQTEDKLQYMTNEESYTQRRMLFKDIWDTAMNIDEKDDIMNKPKVIKTLRLDEVDKCVVGKTKKQRIKNLRHVCNKILDFCDRQDADDVFYEQFAGEGCEPNNASHKMALSNRKKKTHKGKKKVKKTKSLSVPHKDEKQMKKTVSERKTVKVKTTRSPSPIPEKKVGLLKSKAKAVKSKPSPVRQAKPLSPLADASSTDNSGVSHKSVVRRKPVKKKHSRKKKPSDFAVQATGIMKMKTGTGYIPRASPKAQSVSKPIYSTRIIS